MLNTFTHRHIRLYVTASILLALTGCSAHHGPSSTGQPHLAPATRPSTPPAVRPAETSASTPPRPVPPAALPGNRVASWQPIGAAQNRPVVHDVALDECLAVHAATTWQQQGYRSRQDTPAVQDTFVFIDANAARTAYQGLLTAMTGCQARSRARQAAAQVSADATVTQTAQSAAGTAWVRHWTGAPGISAPGVQDNHIYLAYRGATLTAVQVTVLPDRTPVDPVDTNDDGAVLADLAKSLSA